MKSIALFFAASFVLVAARAGAQEIPPADPDGSPIVSPESRTDESDPALRGKDGAPAANTGFQLALRTGYMLPAGSASGAPGDDLSASLGGQVPLMIDIGGKPSPYVFIGAYGGFGFGGVGSSPVVQSPCSSAGVSCVAASFRIGAEVQYHFQPYDKVNPWIGYGIGLEGQGVNMSNGGASVTTSIGGIEWGHFMAGTDFRLSHGVGIGPLIDVSVGEYTHMHQEGTGVATKDADITNTAMHEWIQLGVRVVFFP